jgi:hypothetical protein
MSENMIFLIVVAGMAFLHHLFITNLDDDDD